MNRSTRLALVVLAIAAGFGVLGDALLRATPWGVNVVVWIAPLVAALFALARGWGIGLRGGGRWLALPALFFALSFAWRASFTLNALNLMALLVALGLVAVRARAGRILVAGVTEYVQGVAAAAVASIAGAFQLVLGDIRWLDLPRSAWSKRAVAIGRGLAVALPLLLVFGSLFAAADAVFEDYLLRLFDWDIDAILTHSVFIGFWAMLAGGFLRQALWGRDWIAAPGAERPAGRLGRVEVGTVLGMLNALFLAFVLVQLRYFFGGRDIVESSVGLSYAEYARRGFFELVTVAALALPTLLAVHALLPAGDVAAERLFRYLSGALIALLFVIMASAVQRMLLYQDEFGLTELRLYTTAFMAWLAIIFMWFLATVLRGRRDRFAFGALASGFAVIVALHALNPDALIVRVNTARAGAPRPLDARYLTGLSADAVPALVEALPSLDSAERCVAASTLLYRWSPPRDPDWRTWNLSRVQAWQTVEANRTALEAASCTQ